MQPLRVLDRFPPSEAYLLTLIAAQNLEMIREAQLLTYLDRGTGIDNRDARTALLESALVRANEIEELDHFLERKLERGPRDFRALCRTMFTPAVERTLCTSRNADARRLMAEPSAETPQANGSLAQATEAMDDEDWDQDSERQKAVQSHPWIKAAIAIGLLVAVGWTVIGPALKDRQANALAQGGALAPGESNMEALVHSLCLVYGNKSDVQNQLRHDPFLTKKQREEAQEYAENRVQLSTLFNDTAWYAVRTPGGTKKNYERCLELALEACELSPNDGIVLNTLGVAQYRVGQFKEAVETLSQSYALNRVSERGEQPADVAFLCMAYAKLNKAAEAKEQFRELNRLLKLGIWQSDRECPVFLNEATEALSRIGAKTPPAILLE